MANQIVVSAGAKVRNLNGVLTGTTGVVNSLPINAANGIPQLDVNGKILVSQLPNSVMEYQGTWNAATNTPTLVNGTGNQGDVYLCNVAGTVNFGAGPIAFVVGDQVIYSGSIWQRASGATGTVTSVAITESGDSLNITGSPITTSGTINIGFNGTNLQYVNGAGNLTTFPTLITSIGLSMPSAFSVANSPLTANGTIAVTGAGVASQYIRGDGTLADFPSSGGGGSSVSYYLNGGTSQGTIGGVTYYEMSKTAVTSTGVDFPKTGDGFIVAFLTDANDPAQLNIPAGNWNYEIYASMSANGGTPQMYAELYVYDGTTFTLIATSSNEIIYDGTALNLYTFAMTVPATTLALTDRLAIKLYATNSGGKTTTIHTQDGHLCQIITTFSTGITALNGLTAQVQYFQTGTSGTDFNISSTTATHTFNIPSASATNRGLVTTGSQTIAGDKTFTGTSIFRTNNFENAVEIKDNTSYGVNSGSTTINTERALTVSSIGFNFGSTNKQSKFNFTNTNNYAYTFPDLTGTIAMLEGTQTFTGGKTFDAAYFNGAEFINTAYFDKGLWLVKNGIPSVFTSLQTTIYSEATSNNVIFRDNLSKAKLIFDNSTQTYTFPNASGTIALVGGSGVGTVTSVAALTIGTTGTDLSSTVATSTTTPVITLNVPTASATNRGALSSADWSTFNSKQGTITLTTTGTSGAATFTSNTLNIPNYGSALSGYLPLAGGTMTGAIVGTTSTFTNGGSGIGVGITLSGASGDGLKITHSAGRALNIASSGAGYGIIINNDTASTSIPFTIQKSGSNVITMSDTGAANFTGQLTLGSTITNGSSTYTLPSATGTLALTSAIPANPVGGTGTTNYLPKFTGASTIGNSQIFDNGTNVGINQPSPTRTLDILGASGVGTVLKLQGASGTTTYLQLAYNGATNAQSGYIGYNSSSQMQFFTNDTLRATLDASGNLGLGVTPSDWFVVYKALQIGSYGAAISGQTNDQALTLWSNAYPNASNVETYTTNNAAAKFRMESGAYKWFTAAAGTGAITFTQAMTLFANGGLGLNTTTPTVSTGYQTFSINGSTGGQIEFQTGASGRAYIYSNSSDLRFYTNGGAFRFENTTGLEVGYSAAIGLYKLDVNGTGRFSGNLIATATSTSAPSTGTGLYLGYGASVNNYNGINFQGVSATDMYFGRALSSDDLVIRSSAGEKIRFTSSGNVGIGTVAPVALLNIYGSTHIQLQNATTGATSADGTRIQLSGNDLQIINRETADTILYTSDTERMRITSGGVMRLNSQATYASLTYEQTIQYSTSVAGIWFGNSFNSNNNVALQLRTSNDGTSVQALTLSSTGAATFSSSVTATSFFESSDSRLKTLIQDNYQTKGIASITPKLYTKNGKVELGYYAQDFVGILDSAVSKGSDDMLSLSYREVLVAKVYALEQRIKELENK